MTLLEKDMKETVATEDRRKRLKLVSKTYISKLTLAFEKLFPCYIILNS